MDKLKRCSFVKAAKSLSLSLSFLAFPFHYFDRSASEMHRPQAAVMAHCPALTFISYNAPLLSTTRHTHTHTGPPSIILQRTCSKKKIIILQRIVCQCVYLCAQPFQVFVRCERIPERTTFATFFFFLFSEGNPLLLVKGPIYTIYRIIDINKNPFLKFISFLCV